MRPQVVAPTPITVFTLQASGDATALLRVSSLFSGALPAGSPQPHSMTSWLLLAEAGATEGGLFDLDATLPLMALQVVILTFILNSLFFRPVGKAVEDRDGYISTSRAEAKQKLAQAERLEADLTNQLKAARLETQKLISGSGAGFGSSVSGGPGAGPGGIQRHQRESPPQNRCRTRCGHGAS